MTARCQNGWPVIETAAGVGSYTIPGTSYRVATRPGDSSVILLDVLGFIHAEVEPLLVPGVWGWAVRLVRGSTTDASNHSGGDAIDASAPRHPLGTDPAANWLPNPRQMERIRRRMAAYRAVTGTQVVRWGGDYTGRKDGMHWELLGTVASRRALADAIRGGVLPDAELSYLVGRDTGFRADTTTEEDDMFDPTTHGKQLADLHEMMTAFKGGAEVDAFKPFFVSTAVAGTTEALRSEGVSGAGDTGRLVAALTAELVAEGATSGGLSEAQVEAAAERAVRRVAADAAN